MVPVIDLHAAVLQRLEELVALHHFEQRACEDRQVGTGVGVDFNATHASRAITEVADPY